MVWADLKTNGLAVQDARLDENVRLYDAEKDDFVEPSGLGFGLLTVAERAERTLTDLGKRFVAFISAP